MEEETLDGLSWRSRKAEVAQAEWQKQDRQWRRNTPRTGRERLGTEVSGTSWDERLLSWMEPQDISQEGGGEQQVAGGCGTPVPRRWQNKEQSDHDSVQAGLPPLPL